MYYIEPTITLNAAIRNWQSLSQSNHYIHTFVSVGSQKLFNLLSPSLHIKCPSIVPWPYKLPKSTNALAEHLVVVSPNNPSTHLSLHRLNVCQTALPIFAISTMMINAKATMEIANAGLRVKHWTHSPQDH